MNIPPKLTRIQTAKVLRPDQPISKGPAWNLPINTAQGTGVFYSNPTLAQPISKGPAWNLPINTAQGTGVFYSNPTLAQPISAGPAQNRPISNRLKGVQSA
jgi:arabinogalactan endo-1,4-beta-galactosidase